MRAEIVAERTLEERNRLGFAQAIDLDDLFGGASPTPTTTASQPPADDLFSLLGDAAAAPPTAA